jgi:RimJ/RimL family protein N-acetyltransferase
VRANNIRSQKAMEKLGAFKIGEELIAYYGEASRNNFVYQIDKSNWALI